MAVSTPEERAAKKKLRNRIERLFEANPDLTPAEAMKKVPEAKPGHVYGIRNEMTKAGRCNQVPGYTYGPKKGKGKGPTGSRSRRGNKSTTVAEPPVESSPVITPELAMPAEPLSEDMLLVAAARGQASAVVAHMLELRSVQLRHESERVALEAKHRQSEFVLYASLTQELCKL